MMMTILKDIKEFVKLWKKRLYDEIHSSSITPILGIIQAGNNPASTKYVNNKIKDCEEVGIKVLKVSLPEDVREPDLLTAVSDTAQNSDGIIVQLPLPPQIDITKVKKSIPEEKDVDGFIYDSPYFSCTPLGIMEYLDYCGFNLDGKNVTIIGRSNIVGKPLARMMTDANATVTLCHSHTQNLWPHIQSADLIVSAVGKANFLNCYAIHVPVIDVGINFIEVNGKMKMVGDCYNIENQEVTPVPGGVGLLTRCALLENTWKAANRNKKGE